MKKCYFIFVSCFIIFLAGCAENVDPVYRTFKEYVKYADPDNLFEVVNCEDSDIPSDKGLYVKRQTSINEADSHSGCLEIIYTGDCYTNGGWFYYWFTSYYRLTENWNSMGNEGNMFVLRKDPETGTAYFIKTKYCDFDKWYDKYEVYIYHKSPNYIWLESVGTTLFKDEVTSNYFYTSNIDVYYGYGERLNYQGYVLN